MVLVVVAKVIAGQQRPEKRAVNAAGAEGIAVALGWFLVGQKCPEVKQLHRAEECWYCPEQQEIQMGSVEEMVGDVIANAERYHVSPSPIATHKAEIPRDYASMVSIVKIWI